MFKNLTAEAKKNYLSFLNKIIHFLGDQKIKLEKENNKSILNLEDLTPYLSENDNKEISENYLDSIKWGVLNNRVKNIAISGSFGTGKSTILNLFKHQNPGFKTIDINLGKFEEKNKQTEVDIETSIVQQILYFEKKGKLKESRFERITIRKYIIIKVFFLIIWVYSILYLFFDKIYNKLIISDIKSLNYNAYELFIKIIFLVISALIIKGIFNQISNLKLNKLSFNDAEFVPKANDISIINKHIDELLYFFEKTQTQIVFIEDIDRFQDAVDIFIKLRELNILINNSKDIDKVVTFVYAVKDELFSKNNEKTKFFDLIIPVIPVIDYSNSNTQFIKKLRLDFIDTNILSEDIIFNISPYINDMRTLVNIINEFKIYYKIKTLKTKLDAEKLFGLILLKTIYPIDFKALQNKSGIVYNIFNKKNELVLKESELNRTEIEKLYVDIKNSDNEKIEDINNLRKIYIFELMKLIPDARQIIENRMSFTDLIKDNNFNKFLTAETIYYSTNEIYWDSYRKNSDKTFKDIEKLVNKHFTYKEREKFIQNKNIKSKNENRSRIYYLENENSALEKKNFYELIENIEIEQIDNYFNEIIEQKILNQNSESVESLESYNLLKVLLFNNYVNENYSEYISLFYPESLSLNDYNRKLEIIENKEQSFDFGIENPQKLISELAINNFTKKAILNYTIFDFLLQKKYSEANLAKSDESSINKFNELIKVISNNFDSKVLEFVNGYVIHISQKDDLLKMFVYEMSGWDLFWSSIYSNGNTDVKKVIFEELLTSKTIENSKLITLNVDNSINSFIDEYDDFLINILQRIKSSDLISRLKSLGIKFNKIKYNNQLLEILEGIEKEHLYKINVDNIGLILDKLNKQEINQDKIVSNYTYILKSDCENLKNNIENNINEYVENVTLLLPPNNKEELDSVILLLNNENIEIGNKILLVEKLNFKIQNIKDVTNTNLWYQLVIYNKLIASWFNLLFEYENDVIGDFDYFKDFLNREENYILLSQQKINAEIKIINSSSNGEEEEEEEEEEDNNEVSKREIDYKIVEKFVLDLLKLKLSDESLNHLIKSITIKFDTSQIDRKEILTTLIKNDLINFSYKNIVDLDKSNRILFVEQNQELLNDNYSNFDEFSANVWIDIFNSDIDSQYKQSMFQHISDEGLYSKDNLDLILTIISNIKNNKIQLESKYFIKEALKSNLVIDEKISFLATEISEKYTNSEILEYLNLLSEPFTKIHTKEEFYIEFNSTNEKFIRKLQDRGLLKASFSKKNEVIKITYN